jgi:hypothetical protein
MAEGIAPYYILQNYGTNRNCTLTASFPAVISIEGMEVGGTKGSVNYDVSCDKTLALQNDHKLPFLP